MAARWRSYLLIAVAVLALRLPFLNQAIQGDDVYYLAAAQHAQIDPLHPNRARYVFLGKMVSMLGHPHPPLNGWVLGTLLWLAGDVREPLFHAAYILFSLIAAFSMYSLAVRFTPRPLIATFLFLAVPAFVVNGNSLEADLPFLAFWMAAMALFARAAEDRSPVWLAASAAAMALSAMAAFQAVFLVPILALYLGKQARDWKLGWIAAFTAPAILAAWQIWERASSGALPAEVLSGYFQTYNLQNAFAKAKNAVALTVHLGWMIFPPLVWFAARRAGMLAWAAGAGAAAVGIYKDPNPLFWLCFGTGALILAWLWRERRDFLAGWCLIFFAGALIVFFAGSARYLLPVAAPLAIIVSRTGAWFIPAIAVQMALSVALAAANYQHWDGYRQFANLLPAEKEMKRVWINGEWGLRYYAEARGGLPVVEGQAVQPGEYVVSSELGYPVPYTTGGGRKILMFSGEIRPVVPFVLIGLNARSAYSTASRGLRAFDISTGPVDRLYFHAVVERQPTLSKVSMNSPEADLHIVSGVYQLENAARWMAEKAVILLKRPETPSVLYATVYVPDAAPARRVTLQVDGVEAASREIPGPGLHTVESAPLPGKSGSAAVTISVDKTFQVPGDQRELGVVLGEVGFRSR